MSAPSMKNNKNVSKVKVNWVSSTIKRLTGQFYFTLTSRWPILFKSHLATFSYFCGKTLASKAVFPHEIDKADNENDSEFGQTIILTSSSGLIG